MPDIIEFGLNILGIGNAKNQQSIVVAFIERDNIGKAREQVSRTFQFKPELIKIVIGEARFIIFVIGEITGKYQVVFRKSPPAFLDTPYLVKIRDTGGYLIV